MDRFRWLRHWFHAPASRAFPPAVMQELRDAIAGGEATHDGEICFAVEAALPARFLIGGRRVRERAENVFGELKVWDTERRTGLLIYVLLGDCRIEIVPDRGVAARVPQAAWEQIIARMGEEFRADRWREGALAGIAATHRLLEEHLPPGSGRPRNELPDDPVLLL